MGRTKDWKCIDCNKFVSYKGHDRGTPYGCEDPGAPEPLDDVVWCKECAKKEYKQALKDGIKMYVYWQQPNWQLKALKKLGLVYEDHRLKSLAHTTD